MFQRVVFEQKGEFLLYEGMRSHGSLEQRVLGSFVLNDKNHDHKLSRDEISSLVTDSGEFIGVKYPEEYLKALLDKCLEKADTNGDGFLQLSELINITRSDKNFAKLFGSM